MAQPSVIQFFKSRKRSAVEELKLNRAKKILVLDDSTILKKVSEKSEEPRIVLKKSVHVKEAEPHIVQPLNKPIGGDAKKSNKDPHSAESDGDKAKKTDNLPDQATEDGLSKIKKKLFQSRKLDKLKSSLKNFNNLSSKLSAAEATTSRLQSTTVSSVQSSPTLKNFKSIELEITSPQKILSPEKPYLSPKKDVAIVRRNLFSSPTKDAKPEASSKPALTLPFKYRNVAEIFRAVDTVSQILFNRKETITFSKLKPAVEQMLKRKFTVKHLRQVNKIYSSAYSYKQEKLKSFGGYGEKWELVLTPKLEEGKSMTSEVLLERRRLLFQLLIDKVKSYHKEFLLTLTPPMVIPNDKITRWHPEFDLEKVPELEEEGIPEPPEECKLTTGKEVLEKAREMFNCNTRMGQALARLEAAKESAVSEPCQSTNPESVLKGIPAALLEKVRQRQAAKALFSMTQSADDEKKSQMYARLPDLARLVRTIFVSEKKSVLSLDFVSDKLSNSLRYFVNKQEMEDYLKVIAKEVPGWLVFHNVRHCAFLRLSKNDDLSKVLTKLETLTSRQAKNKNS